MNKTNFKTIYLRIFYLVIMIALSSSVSAQTPNNSCPSYYKVEVFVQTSGICVNGTYNMIWSITPICKWVKGDADRKFTLTPCCGPMTAQNIKIVLTFTGDPTEHYGCRLIKNGELPIQPSYRFFDDINLSTGNDFKKEYIINGCAKGIYSVQFGNHDYVDERTPTQLAGNYPWIDRNPETKYLSSSLGCGWNFFSGLYAGNQLAQYFRVEILPQANNNECPNIQICPGGNPGDPILHN